MTFDYDFNLFFCHFKWFYFVFSSFATISLMLLSLFVTCNQFFGDPIACIKTSDVDIRIINGYCWVEGTFTLPKALLRQIEIEANNYTSLFVASGIDKTVPEKDEKLAQNYYYWVSLVLFLQACSFLIPRILWKVSWCFPIQIGLL